MRCPILPIFLTAVLGAPVAARDIVEGAAAVTKLVAGRAADTVARRRLIALGYGLAAAGKIILAVATVWPVVLLARGIDRLGKGVRGAPRDALLVQGVLAADRGKAFGLHRAVDTAGAVVGPAVGLTLYDLFGHHIRPPLIIAIGPAVASVLLVAVVREHHSDDRHPLRRPPRHRRSTGGYRDKSGPSPPHSPCPHPSTSPTHSCCSGYANSGSPWQQSSAPTSPTTSPTQPRATPRCPVRPTLPPPDLRHRPTLLRHRLPRTRPHQ